MFVTFSWMIEGSSDRGNYMIRLAAYGSGHGAESGPFTIRAGGNETQTWDPTTGRPTLPQPVGEIPTSWAGQITQILGTAVTGKAESAAGLSPCTQG